MEKRVRKSDATATAVEIHEGMNTNPIKGWSVNDTSLGGAIDEDANEDAEALARTRSFGVPTPAQLAKINQFSRRPLTKDEVFAFQAKFVGNGMIEDRYMALDNSLLRKFVQDAKKGIAFMLDHSWAGGLFGSSKLALTYGRSFESVLRESSDQPGETHAQFGSIYIARSDEQKEGISANQIIHDIETGTLFDLSIGFSFRRAECSICGNDIRDYRKCDHYPGGEYDGKLCYALAKPPGKEFEISGVFAGAYESAGILNAMSQSLSSRDEEMKYTEDIKLVDLGEPLTCACNYMRGSLITHVKKEAIRKSVLVETDIVKGGDGMKLDGDQVDERLDVESDSGQLQVDDQGQVVATEAEQDQTASADDVVTEPEALSIPVSEVAAALGEGHDAAAVLQYAKEGLQYRKELVEDALEWGVRAHGNEFPTESWRQLFSEPTRTIDALKDFVAQFKRDAERKVQAGRLSAPDAGRDAKDKDASSEIPDEAFKV